MKYTYPTSAVSTSVDADKLHKEIMGKSGLAKKFNKVYVSGSTIHLEFFRKGTTLTAAQKTTLDNLITAHDGDPLPDLRDKRYAEIDAQTQKLIDKGFTFDNKKFSLSINAQANWTRLKALESSLTWPVKISTKSANGYDLTQANLAGFMAAAHTAIHGHLESGRALKKQVKNATTETAIKNVIDNR